MMTRPENSEAAPYYFTYINRVVDADDIVARLQTQLDESAAIFSQISEEHSLYRYASDKWSIRQVLNHISDTERVTAFRAFWFARGFDSPLPSYDQSTAASSAKADSSSWAAHVDEFKGVRLSTIALFHNLPPDAWMRSGIASDNRFTVRALAFIIGGHFVHHITLLHEKYLVGSRFVASE